MQRFYLMRMEALAGPNPNRLAKRDLPRLPHPPQFSPLILTHSEHVKLHLLYTPASLCLSIKSQIRAVAMIVLV